MIMPLLYSKQHGLSNGINPSKIKFKKKKKKASNLRASTRFIILFNVALSMLLIIGLETPCLSMCLEPPVPLAGSQLFP